MNALYTAEALSTGHGREGRVSTSDETFNVNLASEYELGGLGSGTNPEQLFAAGFADCFHSARHAVAHGKKIKIETSAVGGRMQIGHHDVGGFKLAVELEVTSPDRPHKQAQAIATRGNIDVTLQVSND